VFNLDTGHTTFSPLQVSCHAYSHSEHSKEGLWLPWCLNFCRSTHSGTELDFKNFKYFSGLCSSESQLNLGLRMLPNCTKFGGGAFQTSCQVSIQESRSCSFSDIAMAEVRGTCRTLNTWEEETKKKHDVKTAWKYHVHPGSIHVAHGEFRFLTKLKTHQITPHLPALCATARQESSNGFQIK